jgi:signal peptidase I
LKIEETSRDAAPGGGGAASNGTSQVNGTGPSPGTARPADAADAAEPNRPRGVAELPQVKPSRLLRWVYRAVWFGIVPIALSWLLLWALSPSGAVDSSGLLGWLQAAVRSQPVPVGIVLLTLFEGIFWWARLHLPLAYHAHPPQRADLPPHVRHSFERARVLLDESEVILARYEKAIVRELTAKERERLRADLDGLHEAMVRVPFDEAGFVEAFGKADAEVDVRLGRWRKSEVREYVEAILMAVAVALALRTFVIEAFKIPSGSMIPTLMVGDHIFVNKFIYGPAIPFTNTRVWTNMPPRRGDVMVFAFPEHPEQDFIKRVIAIGGDKLEARNGHPIINGWEVPSCRLGPWSYSDYDSPIARHEGDLYVEFLGDESFLTFYDHASGFFQEYQGPYFAKPGEVWVMGDNRNNSHDSRMWFGGQGGGVPFENIKGRALFVWLSVNEGSVDFSRMGAPVMGHPRLPPSAAALGPQLAECMKHRPAVTLPPR